MRNLTANADTLAFNVPPSAGAGTTRIVQVPVNLPVSQVAGMQARTVTVGLRNRSEANYNVRLIVRYRTKRGKTARRRPAQPERRVLVAGGGPRFAGALARCHTLRAWRADR